MAERIEVFGGDTQDDITLRAAVMALRKNKVVKCPEVNDDETFSLLTPQQAQEWMTDYRWAQYLNRMGKPLGTPRLTPKELKRLVPRSAWDAYIKELREDFQGSKQRLANMQKLRARVFGH